MSAYVRSSLNFRHNVAASRTSKWARSRYSAPGLCFAENTALIRVEPNNWERMLVRQAKLPPKDKTVALLDVADTILLADAKATAPR